MFNDEGQTFQVVTNHEEQYSIWPEHKEVPEGWIAVGPRGPKEECLTYIERVWTDMRPRSLRLEMRDSSVLQETDDGGDSQAELRSVVDRTLARYEDRIKEYEDGRPELFGWFLARVLESIEDEEVDPDAVRAHLNAQLPEASIPDDYA